jgi:hypothetical protein
MGIGVDRPTDSLIEQLGLEKGVGLVVREVLPKSPADQAGIKLHDVLIELNGVAITQDPLSFRKAVDGIKGDTPIDAVVIRKAKKEIVKGIKLPEKQDVRPINVLPGGNTVITNMNRARDMFTIFHREGAATYQIRGKVAEGKDVVEEIAITVGADRKTYKSVDEVPADHQKKVQHLMKLLGEPPVEKKADPKNAV